MQETMILSLSPVSMFTTSLTLLNGGEREWDDLMIQVEDSITIQYEMLYYSIAVDHNSWAKSRLLTWRRKRHPVWPIIISDSNGTRGGGDPVPPPRTSHHTQASSCNGSPRHGRATGNQNCCRLIVYLTHYSRSLQRATSIEFFMGVLLFEEYQLKNEDLGPRWLE